VSFPSIDSVHLRRALLLFAIVLGLAAIAASVSRERDGSGERAEQPAAPPSTGPEETPTVGPGPASDTGVELTFGAERPQRRRLEAGQPATVHVQVDEPGLVEIPELGLNGPADPLTPARFELLVPDPGRYEIDFTPAAGDEASDAGTLVVVEAEA
jgi:hypothetical protein